MIRNLYGWVLWIGGRYIHSKRNGRGVTPSVLSIGGISVGVMTLISVISVMNGLQLGFIEDILEISSYHLRISVDEENGRRLMEELNTWKTISSSAYISDTQTLIQGEYSEYHSALIRVIEAMDAVQDRGLMDHLDMVSGSFVFDSGDGPGAVIGDQLAFRLGVKTGDSVRLVSMSGSAFASLRPKYTAFTVEGIFHSGYYQYDSSLCFIDIDELEQVDNASSGGFIGVKLENRFFDNLAADEILRLVSGMNIDASVDTWREYNKSFFRALRVEKLTMMMLLGLIFLVVAVNIKNSLERSVIEKKEEIGILRAIGAAPVSVRTIFLVEGAMIGCLGAFMGTLAGLMISININQVFRISEILLNTALRITGLLFAPLREGAGIEIFSPNTFYMQEVPVRILYGDVAIIVLFAVFSSILAAYMASKRISEFRPAEILRNE